MRQQKGMKLGLKTMHELMERLGRPECRFPSVHIAGTNGKGSTAAMLESVLRSAGYRTGLYTSPHLTDMRERVRIDGACISRIDLAAFTGAVRPHAESLNASYFETMTALAFRCFAEKAVDVAVVEVGLGGRLDATNVLSPNLSIITEIGLEHTQILGRTLKSIAREKAGILKPKVPFIAGTKRPAIRSYYSRLAAQIRCPMTFAADSVRLSRIHVDRDGNRFSAKTETSFYTDLFVALIGRHQIENARNVLAAVDNLRKTGWDIPDSAVRIGLNTVVWRGRLELLRRKPDVLVDSAHNPHGIRTLVRALRELFRYRRLILVFGALQDKNHRSMLRQIAPLAAVVILTRPKSDRAREPESMASLPCLKDKTVMVRPEIAEAWKTALELAERDDLVCGTGSMFVVGEILHYGA